MATPFNSRLTLYSNVPLDPDYRHTLSFANIMAQLDYFASKQALSIASFTNLSYQRYRRGVIKVQAPMTILDTINYLSFSNPNASGATGPHESRIFYGFITNIEYISDTVCAISYQIDVLQTFMFNYTLNPCYVEREHANSDNVGDNRVTEGLDTGPYVTHAIEKIDNWDSVYATELNDVIQNTTFVIIATQAPDGTTYSYQYNGVASSMYITFAYSTADLENVLDDFRNGATGSLEPIISIGMFPSFFKSSNNTPIVPVSNTLSLDQSVGFGGFSAYDPVTSTIKTYVPKNNKMYCYPYNYMVFEAPDGNTQILKVEDFKNNNVHKFTTWLSILPDIQTMCAPHDYEGSNVGSTTGMNRKYALYCKSYPYCAVASDAFSAWWAQAKYSMPVTAAGIEASDAVASSQPANDDAGFFEKLFNNAPEWIKAFGGSLFSKTGNWLQGVNSAVGAIGGLTSAIADQNPMAIASAITSPAAQVGKNLAATYAHEAVPNTMVTKANNGGVNHYMEWDCYKILYTKIRPEYAEIIDNYFSCFGYATHMVKVPNTSGRRNWNYVQTVGCTISGNIPVEAEQQITKIYDRGVTIWHNPANIHDYTANNDIIS